MTKMKKLLAVVLVCAIMAVCGASAFADISPRTWTIYSRLSNTFATNAAGDFQYMNLYPSSSGSITSSSVPVSVWSRGSDEDQMWYFSSDGTPCEFRCTPTGVDGTVYSLNIYRGSSPYQCTVYPSNGNAYNDKTFCYDVGIVSVGFSGLCLYAPGANAKLSWQYVSPYTDTHARWYTAG